LLSTTCYETSNIIHAGETDYIMTTFNLFTSRPHLPGAFNGNE
jgi:FtsH-binding integral membrane protein